MRIRRKISLFTYLLTDYFAAMLAWSLFYLYRKVFIENYYFEWSFLSYPKFIQGIIIIPLVWLLIYFISGNYTDIYRKSRLSELGRTFTQVSLGCLGLFFLVILDDKIPNYKSYYWLLFSLFSLQFFITFALRLIILTITKSQLQNETVSYKTLLIGGNQSALKLYQEVVNAPRKLGYNFLGFIALSDRQNRELEKYIANLGAVGDIAQVVKQHKIEEVILAIETSDHPKINTILNALSAENIIIKIIPDMYDILSGSVKMNHVLGAVLIEIRPALMAVWQRKIKRIIDVVVSASVLILLLPLYVIIALRVRFSSPGPIFYLQQRVGKDFKPFYIYKFRSMYVDAEKEGPALSSKNDNRITNWGKIMRKWRLDEIPQFYNVLKGDMSLIGPRPERQYYIDKIVEQAPEYKYLLKVQPGLTSWGMVKFGYAENVPQMIERMKYDLLYIENMSLAIDFKIMIYTVLILFQGKGK